MLYSIQIQFMILLELLKWAKAVKKTRGLTDSASQNGNIVNFCNAISCLFYRRGFESLWTANETILWLIVTRQIGNWRPKVKTIVHLLLVTIQTSQNNNILLKLRYLLSHTNYELEIVIRFYVTHWILWKLALVLLYLLFAAFWRLIF